MARRATYAEWTTAEVELLRQHYSTLSAYELVTMFGERHTAQGIRDKGRSLGLYKTPAAKARFNRERWACLDCGSARLGPRRQGRTA